MRSQVWVCAHVQSSGLHTHIKVGHARAPKLHQAGDCVVLEVCRARIMCVYVTAHVYIHAYMHAWVYEHVSSTFALTKYELFTHILVHIHICTYIYIYIYIYISYAYIHLFILHTRRTYTAQAHAHIRHTLFQQAKRGAVHLRHTHTHTQHAHRACMCQPLCTHIAHSGCKMKWNGEISNVLIRYWDSHNYWP